MESVTVKGVRVPKLGLGTWQLTGGRCVHIVRYALEHGYRHIDTAQAYGNESEVGRAMAASGVDRAGIFLSTKLWMENLRRDDVIRSTEDSLRRLGTDYLDLLLIHWPNPRIPLAETLSAMEALRQRGRVRHLGVSNFPVALLREAIDQHGADLLCDQVEYHPFLTQRRILAFLHAHDMVLVAYSPLAHGRVLADPVLAHIGARHGKSPAQVALRWLIEQDRVVVIPKVASEPHCLANFQIFDFRLSEGDRAEIARLGGQRRVIDPGWAPRWDPE